MEYAIWGIPNGSSEETLLVAMPGGKPITDKSVAENLKALLETAHGCKNCRIQELDGSAPDFAKTLR